MYWIGVLIAMALGSLLGMTVVSVKFVKKIEEREKIIYKYRQMKIILYGWLERKRDHRPIENELLEKGMNRIAIYGVGELGKLLYDELEKTSIQVMAGVDQRAIDYKNLVVIPINKCAELDKIDAIINTVTSEEVEVEKMIHEYYKGPIISILELI